MPASNVPGITIDDVVVHAPDGEMQLAIDWHEDQPATASVTYRCPWGSAIQLAKQLRGGFPNGGEGLIAPVAPHAFPLIPELYCCGVSIKPKTDAVRKDDLSGEEGFPFNHHPDALVEAQYKAPDWSFDAAQASEANQIDPGNPILGCRQRVRASTSFLVFEGAKLRYQTSGNVITTSDGIPANQSEVVLEYPRLSRDPTGFLWPFKGRLNSATLWFQPPGHVLFDNFETDRTYTLGDVETSAVLTFLVSHDLSWNERLNDEGEAELVKFVHSSPDKFPFQSANLHAIF